MSDIHMGPAGPLETFRDEVALAAFFDRLAADDTAPPTELVLAGDCFDFLQVAGYDGFDAARAAERFDTILRAPRTERVMRALRRFAQRPDAEITLLAGNHDPEMLVPEVRRRFAEAIGRTEGTVRFADDEPLRHAEGDRPPIWGRALEEGAVWIVHGDRWDPSNMIHRGELAASIREGRPFALPAGSCLVFEVLQKLKPEHGWVDELKPEMPAVLLLLLYLDAPTTWEHIRKQWRLTARLFTDTVMASLRVGPLFGERSEAPRALPEDPVDALAALLAGSLRAEADPAAVLAGLDGYLRGRVEAPSGTLAPHHGIRRHFARAWLENIRRADRFQHKEEPDAVREAALPSLPGSVIALVAGHTHGKRLRSARRPIYANAGTWIPVGAIPPGDIESLIDQLDGGPGWPAEAPRTFVQIELGDGRPRISLGACDADGTPRRLGDGT